MSPATLRLLILGAHPDDAEYHAGGLAAIYREKGHEVRLVSMTNGQAGHFERPTEQAGGAPPAYRVRAELRETVRFVHHNLVTDDPPLTTGEADLVGLAALSGGSVLPGTNTTLVVVATDAALTKSEAHALSLAAHIGIARVTRPSHTTGDGDTAFVLATCDGPRLPLQALSIAVQEVVARALILGAKAARS